MTLTYEAIGQRLKAAREQLGLTQTQVGDFLKVEREIISSYETGSRPDTWTLTKLAYLYGYSVSYFLGAEDTEISIVSDAFPAYNLSPDDLNTIAWLKKFISNLNQINIMLGEQIVPKLSILENKARSYAIKTRNSYALGVMEPIDINKILTIMDVTCIKRPMDTELSGAFFSAEKAKVILINTAKTVGHQNFAVAHELFHALFEEGLEAKACMVGEFDVRDESEITADFFATHFLMPEEGVRYYLARRMKNRDKVDLADVIYLEQLYGVSHPAMLRRLIELEIIDNKTKEGFLPNIRNNALALGYNDVLYRPSKESSIITDYVEKVKLAYDKCDIFFQI